MEPEHFPPSGQALGSAHVLGEEEGAGARAAPAGDGDVRGAEGRARVLFSARRLPRHRAAPAAGREEGREGAAGGGGDSGGGGGSFRGGGGGGQTGLVQRLQPTPFKEMRGGVGRWRRGAGEWEGVGRGGGCGCY